MAINNNNNNNNNNNKNKLIIIIGLIIFPFHIQSDTPQNVYK